MNFVCVIKFYESVLKVKVKGEGFEYVDKSKTNELLLECAKEILGEKPFEVDSEKTKELFKEIKEAKDKNISEIEKELAEIEEEWAEIEKNNVLHKLHLTFDEKLGYGTNEKKQSERALNNTK